MNFIESYRSALAAEPLRTKCRWHMVSGVMCIVLGLFDFPIFAPGLALGVFKLWFVWELIGEIDAEP